MAIKFLKQKYITHKSERLILESLNKYQWIPDILYNHKQTACS